MSGNTERLNIAFLSAYDMNDISVWSGTYYHMARALQEHCGEVRQIGPIHCWEQTLARSLDRGTRYILKKNFNRFQCFPVARKFGKVAAQRLVQQSFDVIFAPAAQPEVAFLTTDIPIVLAEDATFGQLIDYYPDFSNLLKRSIYELNAVESMALEKADLIVASSEWNARSVIEDYGMNPQKVHVVPFGANMSTPPSEVEVLRRKKSSHCRLLFVGADWERKGGSIAFETLLKLEEMGIAAELIICGCTPPAMFSHQNMRVIPFLDKRDEKQREKLEKLLMQSNFLLLPTRGDCTPIVFCEASAYCLPAITANTGGVAGVIRDGENGFMLPFSARGAEYAEVIANVYREDQRYADLVKSSRAAFDHRLNWDAWGRSMCQLITEMLNQQQPQKESLISDKSLA